jgi:hypothetical protein
VAGQLAKTPTAAGVRYGQFSPEDLALLNPQQRGA